MNKLKCIYINLFAMFCADQSVLKGIPVLKILLTDNFLLQSRAASGLARGEIKTLLGAA